MNAIETEDRLGIPFCRRQKLAIARGAGSRVWDTDGHEYLDFTSGWGVTSLGHCHPVMQQALLAQAGKLTQNPNSGFSYSPARAALMQRLSGLLPAPLTRMYFVNSGAEANDAAIKMARRITGRSGIVSTLGAFHGRTLNTLAVSGDPAAAGLHRPRFPGNRFVPFGDLSTLARVIDEDTAAVIVEPVQGEGGVRIPAADYLAGVQALCRRHGALLIVDEIQTGICRTGSLFAIEQCRPAVAPDMMTLGKGLAGGFPFAALIMSEDCAGKVTAGDHGGTYCGNPLGCAVADAVLDYLVREDVAAHVRRMGQLLDRALAGLKQRYPQWLLQVRGRGLLWALQLPTDEAVSLLGDACLARGLLLTPTRGAIMRLIPSLLVSAAEIAEAMDKLEEALASVPAMEFTLDCSASLSART